MVGLSSRRDWFEFVCVGDAVRARNGRGVSGMESLYNVSTIMRLVDLISGPLRNIQAAVDGTGQRVAGLSERMGRFASSMLPVAAVAGAVMLALGSSVGVAADFEQAISQVGAVSNATAHDMSVYKNVALELGETTAWSASQVAQAQKYLAMAGFSVADNMAALPGVLDLASAANTDLARTADIASDILSGFKLPATEMGRAADVLAATVTSANTNLEMLGDTMKYVAPVAQKAGMSLEETAAMAGLLANIGIKGSQSGTVLRSMLSRLAAPAGAAGKTLAALGVTATDISANLRSPITLLGEMATKMEGMGSGDQLKHLSTIFGQEAMAGVSELIGQEGVGGISKYLEIIQNSTGKAAEIAKRQLDNFKGSVTLLGSAWEGVQNTLGSMFLPVLKDLTYGLTDVVLLFNRMAKSPVGQWLIKVAGYVSAVVVAITLFAGAWWGVAAVLPIIKAGFIGVGTSIKALLLPFWPVIAIAGAFYLAWRTNLGGIQEKLSAFYGSVKLVFQGVTAIFATLTGSTGEIGAELADKLRSAGLLEVVTSISKVIYRLREMFSGMWDGLVSATSGISEIFTPVIVSLISALTPVGKLIGWIAGALFGLGASTESSSWQTFGAIIGVTLGSAFKMLAWAVRAVIFPFELLFDLIGWVGSGLVDLGQWFMGINLFESGARMINTLVDGIKSQISAPVEAVKGVLNKVRNLLPFSDAKEGPLSQLTLSGSKILDTLGVGMQIAAPGLQKTALAALAGVAAAAPVLLPAPVMASPTPMELAAPVMSAPAPFRVPAPTIPNPAPMELTAEAMVNPVMDGQVSLDGTVAVKPPSIAADKQGGSRSGSISSKRSTTINIQKIILSNVTSGAGFVAELQKIVDGYDV